MARTRIGKRKRFAVSTLLVLALVLSIWSGAVHHVANDERLSEVALAAADVVSVGTGSYAKEASIANAAGGFEVFFPLVVKLDQGSSTGGDWYTLAANPQRTSWVPEEVRGNLSVEWYRPIEPYIPYKVQIIASNGILYISTSRGLYALNATNGDVRWVYSTELPLGHSPTVTTVNGRNTAYVGGYDRKIHAVDALTGQKISGYTPHEAGAGFETNPLVVNSVIYAGNRDGYFYALDAVTGALRWRYKTDGPVLFSAAYKNGVVYFASNDSHAYALNASDGSLVWKSQKFPGQGFHSFWPVVYTNKATGKDYVIFSGSENYRFSDLNLVVTETAEIIPDRANFAEGTPIGPTGTVPGDWASGTMTIDLTKITNYFEDKPYRRTVFVLDSQTGQEYTFDSDNDGRPEYAPFNWSGATHSGSRYPAVVGKDGVLYQNTGYVYSSWIYRGDPVGWKFGTQYVSRVSGGGIGHAGDEPNSFSSGGNLIYWSLCCDREAGSFDVNTPYGQPNRSWSYFGYDIMNKAPDYDPMYFDGNTTLYNSPEGWQVYSGAYQSKNGVYTKHGATQSPPIPYRGKVYMLRGNTVVAFSPTASRLKLPLATTVSVPNPPTALARSEPQQRLESEVQKIVSAGHLRPGYHAAGFIDLWGMGRWSDDKEFGEIFDYFQNPAETVVTLIQALPYLSPTLQQQTKDYLQLYYGPSGQFPFTRIAHIGWQNGAAREAFDIPQDRAAQYNSSGPRTTPLCAGCGYWNSFPPYSFYAAWKYAQAFGGAKAIFDQMSTKLDTPPGDDYLTRKPYILNQYLAGYLGYLELQQLAGVPESSTVRNTYNRLLSLRSTSFSKDTPYVTGSGNAHDTGWYNRALSIARNFMFLTPELGDYLNRNTGTQAQNAVHEYTYVAPYWFVSKFDNSLGEGTLQHLYDSPALFQAKAYVLKEPYGELVKWLDVPAFYRGDLFHIQNLVAALRAP